MEKDRKDNIKKQIYDFANIHIGTKILEDQYNIIKLLKSDGREQLHLAKDIKSGKLMLLKSINLMDVANEYSLYEVDEYISFVKDEFDKVKQLTNYGITHKLPIYHEIFYNYPNIYIVSDYIEGKTLNNTIIDMVGSDPNIDNNKLANIYKDILAQILGLLVFIHENNIVHGAIQSENIILKTKCNNSFDVCLTNFRFKPIFDMSPNIKYFIPPEELIDGVPDDKYDIWSLGITMLILFGINPWENTNDIQEYYRNLIAQSTPISQTGFEFLDFIVNLMLKFNPEERPSAKELFSYFDEINNNQTDNN